MTKTFTKKLNSSRLSNDPNATRRLLVRQIDRKPLSVSKLALLTDEERRWVENITAAEIATLSAEMAALSAPRLQCVSDPTSTRSEDDDDSVTDELCEWCGEHFIWTEAEKHGHKTCRDCSEGGHCSNCDFGYFDDSAIRQWDDDILCDKCEVEKGERENAQDMLTEIEDLAEQLDYGCNVSITMRRNPESPDYLQAVPEGTLTHDNDDGDEDVEISVWIVTHQDFVALKEKLQQRVERNQRRAERRSIPHAARTKEEKKLVK